MKDYNKYYKAISEIDFQDEKKIVNALTKSGLYSNSQIYPLASLQLELTSHCNARCKHCYNNSGINNIVDDMTPEKWIDFAKYIVQNGGVFECLISGGEPLLLGTQLFEIMDIFHNDGTCFLFQTNGYLLTEEISKKLQKYKYHWIQISIDGITEEYHDSFRQRKGSWKNAIDGAKMISQKGLPLKIAHCITPYNLHEIDQMCNLAHSIGASAITIGELCLSGRVSQNLNLLLSNSQREFLYEKINENRVKYKNIMKVKSSNSIKFGLERHKRKPYASLLIRPNGDIRIDGMAPFVIGNILKDDFTNILKSKLNTCWNNQKVEQFISGFNKDDRNYSKINFVDQDIKI